MAQEAITANISSIANQNAVLSSPASTISLTIHSRAAATGAGRPSAINQPIAWYSRRCSQRTERPAARPSRCANCPGGLHAVCIIVSLMARLYAGKWVPDSQAVLQHLTMVNVFTIARLATRPGRRSDDAGLLKRQFISCSDNPGQ